MRRLLVLLMVAALATAAHAELAITDGTFDSQAGGSVDVANWFDKQDGQGTSWWNGAGIIDSGSGSFHVSPFGSPGVLFGSDESFSDLGWMYQNVGTKSPGVNYRLSFVWGQPTDGATNREVGLQVDVYQGTYTGADGTDIASGGLTLIDSILTSTTTTLDIQNFSETLDLSTANTTDPLWLCIRNRALAGGDWVAIDDIAISVERSASNPDPSNGQTGVSIDKILSWSAPVDPNLDPAYTITYDVYLDPNETNVATASGSCQYTSLGQTALTFDPVPDLANLTQYYWAVNAHVKFDDKTEPNVISGPVWNFTTITDGPIVSAVSPVLTVVDAGEPNAILSVTAFNGSIQWYKDSDANPLSDGADYSGTTAETLVINDVQLADEGYYYCKVVNIAGTVTSAAGRVLTTRLMSHYPFETTSVVDGNEIAPDIIGGYDMTLMSGAIAGEGDGLDYPTLTAGVPELGGNALFFNNSNAADPNNAWGQYAVIEPGVVDYEDITIALWVYWNGGANWQRIFDFGNSTTQYMFLTPGNGSQCRFVIRNGGGEQIVSTSPLPTGQWIYLTATLAGDTARLYVNGELASTNTGVTIDPIDFRPVRNYVGSSQYPTDPYFNGLIDDLIIYNYARTTEQVAQDYLDVRGDWVCNNEGTADLTYDLNNDCQVDLGDLALLAADWLNSNRIYPQ